MAEETIQYIVLALIFGAGVIGVIVFAWTIYTDART